VVLGTALQVKYENAPGMAGLRHFVVRGLLGVVLQAAPLVRHVHAPLSAGLPGVYGIVYDA
jgi:hypothetical protein